MIPKYKVSLIISILIFLAFFTVQSLLLLDVIQYSKNLDYFEIVCFISFFIPFYFFIKGFNNKIKQKEKEFSNRMDAINKSNAVIEFNLDGTIIFANDLFLNALGYEHHDEIVGKHHSIFIEDEYKNSDELSLIHI